MRGNDQLINLNLVANAIRQEIIRQYRDCDREKCPAGLAFWEDDIQPMLIAEVAVRALQQQEKT